MAHRQSFGVAGEETEPSSEVVRQLESELVSEPWVSSEFSEGNSGRGLEDKTLGGVSPGTKGDPILSSGDSSVTVIRRSSALLGGSTGGGLLGETVTGSWGCGGHWGGRFEF